MTAFVQYGSTPRLFRDCVLTEKIHGSNAGIQIEQSQETADRAPHPFSTPVSGEDGEIFLVTAQSRKRLIGPEKTDDNYGFARWVSENARGLVNTLGPGVHFGEWWGSGIQHGYGLPKGDKRFWLFNVARWGWLSPAHQDYPGPSVPGLGVVPIVYEGPFSTEVVKGALGALANSGSVAVPGFMDPEGVVVFHNASGQVFKATIKNDETPKSLVK